MIIQGILDNSLNGQLCIRGFANIKELAQCSQADYSYQRNLIERTDITDFLETQEYLFFPEVILSYKIKHRFHKDKDVPIKAIQSGKNYKSAINGDSFIIKSIPPKDTFSKIIRIATLIVNDKLDKPFHRIDGNHRLDAAEKSTSEKVEGMVVPFCLLLGTEFYDQDTGTRVSNVCSFVSVEPFCNQSFSDIVVEDIIVDKFLLGIFLSLCSNDIYRKRMVVKLITLRASVISAQDFLCIFLVLMRDKDIMPRTTMICGVHIGSFLTAENSLLYCILRHACQ